MGNDIEIRVRVANNTASGLAAVNTSLNRLRDEARDAGQSLTTLATRAAAASVALRSLKDAAQDASRALRSLNQAARTTDTRLAGLSDRSRALRSDTDDLDSSMQRLTTTMGGLRGGLGSLRTASNGGSEGLNSMRTAALLLSPALIPIAASLVPIAVNAGAAGIAIGAFGAAVIGQASVMKDAADAEKKYNEAVKKHGAASEQATTAEADYLAQVRQMDPATRRSAASLSVLKDTYKQWSKDLAGDTMPVVTKGFATFGALLPRLAPTVRATSTELDRLMTVLAGGVSSGGFDKFMASFQEFSSGALSKATDGLVRFMRTMSGGTGSSQLSEFMQYVRDVGPQVGETLGNLARALTHLVASASEAGVSILSAVNAFAQLVNAIPTDVLSTLLQFVVVFKAVKLAAAGLGASAGGMAAFGASLAAMRAAASGAGGGLAGLAAAFGTLSRAAKVAVIGTGIGLLVVAMMRLSEIGKKAPPDIDKMTTSLGQLAQTGKLGGEAARVLGADMGALGEAVRGMERPSNLDKVQQSLTSLIGMDSTPVKEWKETLDGLDKGLAGLVKGGNADLAKTVFEDAARSMKKQGLSTKELRSNLDDYKAALADQAFEQQLAASAMGLFGDQALAVGAKLSAQKQSADGLRQSIEALNDANRSALGGMIGFEASIDAAAKAAAENAGSLDMVNGKLDVNSPKAQAAATALNDLAAKTKDAALAARESGESWESVNGIYERGQAAFIKSAQAMGLSRAEAKQLAGEIMNIPDSKKTLLKMEKEDAEAGLRAFNAAVKRVPGAKSVTLKTLSSGAEEILETFGYKVKRLPNGKVKVTAATGSALSGIGSVSSALSRLDGKTARTYTHHSVTTTYKNIETFRAAHGRASGGLAPGYADGGAVQSYPTGGLISGPGTPTSDSILMLPPGGGAYRASDREYIVQASSVRKYGVQFLDALNSGRLKLAGFAKGGVTKSEREARNAARGDLTISHFGQKAGYKNSEIRNDLGSPDSIGALVSSLNQWRSSIMKSTHGGQEKSLLRTLDATGKKLITYQRQLDKASVSLGKSKERLDELKNSAAQLKDSVKSGVLNSANITKGAGGDAPVTVASVMGGLTRSRDQAKAWAAALAALKKKGLSGSLIEQISEAGIDGGGLQTAGALMNASSSEIKSMNSLQGQIATSASAAGKTSSDAVYGTAIKVQQALVKSWERTTGKLEKAMDKLAKAMEKSIEKAYGKKAAGGIVGAAASGGMRSGLTMVGEQGVELLDLPAGARVWSNPDTRRKVAAQAPWTSMLNAPRPGRGAAGASSGGGVQPIVVHQTITLDGRVVAQQIFDPLRKEYRARGGLRGSFPSDFRGLPQ